MFYYYKDCPQIIIASLEDVKINMANNSWRPAKEEKYGNRNQNKVLSRTFALEDLVMSFIEIKLERIFKFRTNMIKIGVIMKGIARRKIPFVV